MNLTYDRRKLRISPAKAGLTVVTKQQLGLLVLAEVQRRHQVWLRRRFHVHDPRGPGSGDQLKVMPNTAAERPFVRRIDALDHRHQRRGLARGELFQQQETVDGVGVGRGAPDGPRRVVLPLEDRQSATNGHTL